MKKPGIILNVKIIIFLLLLVECVFFTLSCSSSASALRTDDVFSRYEPAKHLVFIGLDGWGGDYLSNADMPAVKGMMTRGASTVKMRCILPSVSLPNWTALFTSAKLKDHKSSQIPSIFRLVNDKQKSSSVLFYEWSVLLNLCNDERTEKRTILSNIESAQNIAEYIIENKPVFTAVVFDQPDSTGHSKRWGSLPYYEKLAEMDALIAIIEQAVKDAGIYDDTVFMLSSDHGGFFLWHGYTFLQKHRRIPFVISGNGIKENYIISGSSSIYDIAPTMAAILGLEIPPEWRGQPVLKIFK